MAQAFHPVETHGLEASVAQHLGHLYKVNSQRTSGKQDTRRILLNIWFDYTYVFHMHLGIFLTILLENELSLQPLVFVLSPPPVFSSFSLVLRHLGRSKLGFVLL